MYYYAVMIMEHTVVAIFKHDAEVTVTPTDVNMILHYCRTNLKERSDKVDSFYRELCLPGMTEDYKLPLLFTCSH